MNRQILKNRIRKIEQSVQKDLDHNNNHLIKRISYQRIAEAVRHKLKKAIPFLKKAVLSSAFGAATFFPVGQTAPNASPNPAYRAEMRDMAEQIREKQIGRIVESKARKLQNEIINKTDSLQKLIKNAPPVRKNKIVSEMFNQVYKNCGFNANFNYCVAGTMYVRLQCNDHVLNSLLPDPAKKPKDYYPKMGNHPNVVCTTMEQFFKDNYGENYAEKGKQNFKQFLGTIEAGDIITVFSSRNTSTGKHCLTCAGPIKNGMLPVKGFNGEKTYEVPVSKINSAVKVIEQYRQELTRRLQAEMEVENFMPVIAEKESMLNFSDYAALESSGLQNEALKNENKIESQKAFAMVEDNTTQKTAPNVQKSKLTAQLAAFLKDNQRRI